MKHYFVSSTGSEIYLKDSNAMKLLQSDKCKYCNKAIYQMHDELSNEYLYSHFSNIDLELLFWDDKLTCITDEEYVIKQILE